MRFILSLLSTVSLAVSGVSALPARRWNDGKPPQNVGTTKIPRVVSYMAYFHENQNEGPYTDLYPIVRNDSGITDVLLFVCNFQKQAPFLTVGGEAPDNTTFLGPLWEEVKEIQAGGINVYASFGGYTSDTFLLLQGNFDFYYGILRDFLREYNLSGVDFNVEPSTNTLSTWASGETILRLLKQTRADFGPDFQITMAPVAEDLTAAPDYFSGFDYKRLDEAAVDDSGNKIINHFNTQFYSGFGACNETDRYDEIIGNGYDPERVVMLVSAAERTATPWCNITTLETVASTLAENYTNFGGFGGYEFVFAGRSDNITRIEWYQRIAAAIGL